MDLCELKLVPEGGQQRFLSDFLGQGIRLHGKHGVGVPEPEFRSRSPGVKFMENTESKIWKTRSLT